MIRQILVRLGLKGLIGPSKEEKARIEKWKAGAEEFNKLKIVYIALNNSHHIRAQIFFVPSYNIANPYIKFLPNEIGFNTNLGQRYVTVAKGMFKKDE
jgi:hypothetical protein